MKSITATALIAFCLLFMNSPQAVGCECETKTELEPMDWNDAGIIVQAMIVEASIEDGMGQIEFEPKLVYKGDHPGDRVVLTYLLEGEHALTHDLAGIEKDQQWILFLEKGRTGLQLHSSNNPAFCALSRKMANSEESQSLAFLEEMTKHTNGPVRLYHDNGNLRAKGTYNRGAAMGKWSYYDELGQLSESGNYLVGRRNGMWDNYTMNEKTGKNEVTSRSQYALGRIYTREEYHTDGKVKAKHMYMEDENQSSYYDEQGQLESKIMSLPTGESSVTAHYYPGGALREISVVRNGRTVKQTMYNEEGEILSSNQGSTVTVSSE